MSLGTIGHLMAGSGLHEVLDLIYANNDVDHILSGKAIARAVCAHLLVDAALNTLIASKASTQIYFRVTMKHTDVVHLGSCQLLAKIITDDLPG